MVCSVVHRLTQGFGFSGLGFMPLKRSPNHVGAAALESPTRACPVKVFEIYLIFMTFYEPDLPEALS